MKTIAIVNGPNLHRLGQREPGVYGAGTLTDLERQLRSEAEGLGVAVRFFQSNHEGALVDHLWELADAGVAGVVLNPAAYTHTSVALRDAIKGSGLRVIEVHISNVHQREEFRHHSYISAVAAGVICGLGLQGYSLALRALA
ncbi:MAG: type II 3-dehydroquinate dehydratase [Verrucomicrobiota bacterium JB022]|nr:type II 3-dehydroquinate dehydratase [Verrucomicrobiota bacterium JB022]